MKIPRRMRLFFQLVLSYWADGKRFGVTSGVFRSVQPKVLEARLIKDYHRIEKGLALSDPRPWFGQAVFQRIAEDLERYAASSDADADIICSVRAASAAYSRSWPDPPQWVGDTLAQIDAATVGVVIDGRDDIAGTEEYEAFLDPDAGDLVRRAMRSRSSLRNFSEVAVPREVLEVAVADALFSPSVCNRQATRTRWFHRADPQFHLCLKHQNGNRGFGASAQWIGLITYDNRCFLTPGERNQGYIDAGLFTMTLQYSLHAQGLGSCCLNWSMNARQDQRLRADVFVPDHETVVMMLAVGLPAPTARATVSPRRAAATVFLNQ